MVVLLILVVSCLIFRGLGFAGITVFGSWQTSARDALSLMLVFTSVSHFTFMKEDFVRMMPPSIPWPRAMVFFTGVCELVGAIGLLLPEFRQAAAYALIAFFVAVPPGLVTFDSPLDIPSFVNACSDPKQTSSALPCWQFFFEITAAYTRFHHLRSEIQDASSSALSTDSSRVDV